MKNALLCTLLTFSTFLTHAQQPEKVIPFSKEASPFIRDIVLDQDKNTFIAGYFTSQITIGDSSYTTHGKSDVLIAMIDSNGKVQWVRTLGGEEEDRAHAISLAPDGSLYVSGYFSDDVFLYTGDTLKHINDKDALLVKLDNTGNILWSKTQGTVGDDEFYDVSIGATNKPVVCGYFSNSMAINTLTGTKIFTTVEARPLLAQLNQNGTYEWASSLNTSERTYLYGIHHSDDSSILATGHFTGKFPTPDSKEINSEGAQDIFIAQFDSEGNYIKYNTFGSSGDDAGYAVTSTDDGIFLVGNFSTQLRIEDASDLMSFGIRDGVVLKLDKNLKTVKAAQLGGRGLDQAYKIAAGNNNIFVTGSFLGIASFNGDLPTHPRTSRGGEDIYLSKYNGNLDLQWTQTVGANSRDVATGIAYLNGSISLSGTSFAIGFPYATATLPNTGFTGSTIVQLKDCEFSPTLWAKEDWLKPQENFDQIQWLDCNNNLVAIVGATRDSFLLETSGLYAARITKDGCESITECYEYKSKISTNDITTAPSRIWPNPTTNYLYFSTEKPLVQATVINTLGKTIYQGLSIDDKIDATEWLAGYYYLILETSEGKSVQKVVKI